MSADKSDNLDKKQLQHKKEQKGKKKLSDALRKNLLRRKNTDDK